MRNISFMLTTDQIRQRTKTVTRRMGWANLVEGQLLQGVVKSQGLKKGEKIQPLAVIRVKSVRLERLDSITQADVIAEGFPMFTPAQFIGMFCTANKYCEPDSIVTRIEFDYPPTP